MMLKSLGLANIDLCNTLRLCGVSSLSVKHGVPTESIAHAVEQCLVAVDLDVDGDPPRVPAIGPDPAGNLLEVIWLELADDQMLVIHAMPLRPAFYGLLSEGDTS